MANNERFHLVLGSKSKGRRQCLDQAGLQYESMVADIDEKAVAIPGSERSKNDPEVLTVSIAKAKAAALVPALKERQSQLELPILLITSDQVVHYNDEIREKPESEQQVREYLKSYETSPAVTVSGVVVTNVRTGCQHVGVDVAKQWFKPIPEHVVQHLINAGDVYYCCGGFLIDDPVLEPFLDRRDGSRDSIIGLPMELTQTLIEKALL